jgi:hypothetical protein
MDINLNPPYPERNEDETNQQYIKKVITPFKDKSKTITKNLIQNHLDNNNENIKEEKYHNALNDFSYKREITPLLRHDNLGMGNTIIHDDDEDE